MTRTGDSRDTAELLEQTADAARAWMRGDVERYLELTHHAPGFTLAAPTGGPPEQFADRRAGFQGWSSPFSEGDATLEITATHVWDDTAVLVMIERQHGRLAGSPVQDLSLRVTQVYRWSGSEWQLVHRHADPLVRPLSIQQLSAVLG